MIAFSPWVPWVIAAWVLVPLIELLVIGFVRARRNREPQSFVKFGTESTFGTRVAEFKRDDEFGFGQGAVSRVPRSSDPAAASGSAVHGPAHGVAERDGSPAAPVSPEWQPDLRGVCSPEKLREIADDVAAMRRIPSSLNVTPEFVASHQPLSTNSAQLLAELTDETACPFLAPEPSARCLPPGHVGGVHA